MAINEMYHHCISDACLERFLGQFFYEFYDRIQDVQQRRLQALVMTAKGDGT